MPIVDDMTLNDERPNAFAELRPIATHARLFDEQLESIEDGIDESIGGFEAGIFRDVGPDVFKVLLGKRGKPIGYYDFLARAARPRDLIRPASWRPEVLSYAFASPRAN